MRKLNLPNQITCARLVLTAIFVAAASWGGFGGYLVALLAFILAAVSDWLDGYLARKLGLVTSLGKLLDPLADKILVTSAFVFFSARGLCPVWITAVIIAREFLVTGLRQIAVEKGEVIAADQLGKWKTTFQLAYGITALLHLTLAEAGGASSAPWSLLADLASPASWLFQLFLWGALVLTVLSGANYVGKSKSLLLD
ncbi:MAG: CDP-diacylglycerol--glycerol-3-phosphate 3-phosphatidyltransferase [Verrucomicrobiales bacterium]